MGRRPEQAVCKRLFERRGFHVNKIWQTKIVQNVVVFPSRATAIEEALRWLSPKLAIVDKHLTKHLRRKWMTSLNKDTHGTAEDVATVIEAPRQSDLMVELIRKLKPQVVITGLASFEAITSAAFENLLDVTGEIGSRRFLDISDHFELSSLRSAIGVLKYLAGNSLPPHATIICGLLKNQVYKDLEVAFMISEDKTIFQALARTVELLEGNTPLISQNYYDRLFKQLLSFQLADRHPLAMVYKDLEVAFMISEDATIFQALARTVELLEGNTALIRHNCYDRLFKELLSFQLADRHPLAMDGVILGADSRAIEGPIVADKNCEKIHYMVPNIYCCGAGTAADTENVTVSAGRGSGVGLVDNQIYRLEVDATRTEGVQGRKTGWGAVLYNEKGKRINHACGVIQPDSSDTLLLEMEGVVSGIEWVVELGSLDVKDVKRVNVNYIVVYNDNVGACRYLRGGEFKKSKTDEYEDRRERFMKLKSKFRHLDLRWFSRTLNRAAHNVARAQFRKKE